MAYYPYNQFNNYPYQQYTQPQQSSNGIIWVQGIEAMKSYPVSPGQSALLMDAESNCFGIKTVDASGMPLPLRIFDYTERTAHQASQQPVTTPIDTSNYITREEFESRIAQITAFTEREEANAE